VEYKDDLHHRVKVGVCHTIGDNQTTENCVGVSRAVDVDVASWGTTNRSDEDWLSSRRVGRVSIGSSSQTRNPLSVRRSLLEGIANKSAMV